MKFICILFVILLIIIKTTLPVHSSFVDKITNSAERINHEFDDNDLNGANFNHHHHHRHPHHQRHGHHCHDHHDDHHQHHHRDDNHGTDDTTITTIATSLIDVRAGNPTNSRI